MVTTPNSMKFLKFMENGFTKENVEFWLKHIEPSFGVVKYDKSTRFFNGNLVQSSYQLLNTLNLSREECASLLKPSIDYLTTIRNDYDFLRFHFKEAFNSKNGDESFKKDKERSNIIINFLNKNSEFQYTKLFLDFRNDIVEDFKNDLQQGHILLPGTNATIFGNGPEMLLELAGEFSLEKQNKSGILGVGEIACNKFKNKEQVVCARSPHITMGNIYCATNNLSNDIWKYFDLGDNIVCINAIGENIQYRLNGCDYDSDSMLITNDSLIVNKAFLEKDNFIVPVCKIEPKKQNFSLAELDYFNSNNKIGEIINLSQKINCHIWEKYHNNEDITMIYNDVCKLAVLSGIEIDKAKRAYENINASEEINNIRRKYDKDNIYPKFFKKIKQVSSNDEKKVEYRFFNSAMEQIYEISSNIRFAKGKPKNAIHKNIIDLISKPLNYSFDINLRDNIIEDCKKYCKFIKLNQINIRKASSDEQKVLYNKFKIMKERINNKIIEKLNSESIIYSILEYFTDNNITNFYMYEPILRSKLINKLIINNKSNLKNVIYNENGQYKLYCLSFSKE